VNKTFGKWLETQVEAQVTTRKL